MIVKPLDITDIIYIYIYTNVCGSRNKRLRENRRNPRAARTRVYVVFRNGSRPSEAIGARCVVLSWYAASAYGKRERNPFGRRGRSVGRSAEEEGKACERYARSFPRKCLAYNFQR